MNITSNSQLLASLTSLVDPNQRQQQQTLQDQQNLSRKQQKITAEQTGKIAKNSNRQGRIDANREALKKLQDRLKSDNLEKLKNELSVSDQNNAKKSPSLNLRENLGDARPKNTRPGQIIDIRV